MASEHRFTTCQRRRLIQLAETGPIPRQRSNYETALEALRTRGLAKRNREQWSITRTGEKAYARIAEYRARMKQAA